MLKISELEQNKLNNDLIEATRTDDLNAVQVLLTNGADVDSRNHIGTTPLILAAYGDIRIARALIAKDANVNAQNILGTTPLLAAAYEGQSEAVQLLLDNGADANLQNKRGTTALTAAIYKNRFDIVEMLHKHGVDISFIRTFILEQADEEQGSNPSLKRLFNFFSQGYEETNTLLPKTPIAPIDPALRRWDNN